VSQVRAFAEQQGLRVGKRYTHYADWPGDRIVTTVVATRPGRIEAEGFWFPIVGRVPYKGYFDPARAEAEALRLRQRGLDVCQVRVPAYSTLGWFDDPVTGPMLRESEALLVEMLFHELVHATLFVPGDAAFSEGLASFIGEEARVRFYAASEGPDAAARERRHVASQRRVRDLLLRARSRAERVYALLPEGAERDAARSALDEELHAQLAALADAPPDPPAPVRLRTNDACLALAATYSGDTPCLAARLAAQGGDLAAFVARVLETAEAPDPRLALLGAGACEEPAGEAGRSSQSRRSSTTSKYST
jgi:predicted aminopeptidase